MCDDGDDLIPEDPRPRLRKLDRPTLPARKGGRCMECPRHDGTKAWCPILAAPRAGRSPMCRYGWALLAKTGKG